MTKLTLDLTAIKNEITVIHNEAFQGVEGKTDLERRDILLKVVERLKALKTSMDSGNVKLEVK